MNTPHSARRWALLCLAVNCLTHKLPAHAQAPLASNPISGEISFSGTRLAYPLVEAWIKEFNKAEPHVSIKLATPGSGAATIRIASYTLASSDLQPGETFVTVCNYAQLPVANRRHPQLAAWTTHGLTEAELKKLFFKSSQEETKDNRVTIYTRGRPVCAAKSFAAHYGVKFKESRGLSVTGDDQALIEATRKDVNGVTYNNLGFIYDLNTRQITDGIAILPIDLNENGTLDPEENFYSTLDDVLARLESGRVSKITVDKVNFIYKKEPENPALSAFLSYIEKEGQRLVHQFGFLPPGTDLKLAASRIDRADSAAR